MKIIDMVEKAKADILSGEFGPSGTRFCDINSVAERYGLSYVTALKLITMLKNDKMLLPMGNKCYIMTGQCDEKSELYKLVHKPSEQKLGILVPTFTNPFMAETTEWLSDTLVKRGITPVISLARDENEIAVMEGLAQSGCMGIFSFLKNQTENIIDYYSRFPLPIVTIGKRPNNICVSSVTSDSYAAGITAARHLHDCGFSTCAFITSKNNIAVNDERLNGFRDGLAKLNIDLPDEQVFVLNHDEPKTGNAILAFMAKTNERVGFFCYHDMMAMELYFILRNSGYNIPKDAGIIGYDNLATMRGEMKLTTFAYSFNRMAETALDIMLEQCAKPTAKKKNVSIQTTMMIRRSTNDGDIKLTETICGS